MKRIFLASLFVLCFCLSNAQDSLKRFELGCTLLSYNFNVPDGQTYFFQNKSSLDYLNGLFFRYSYKRIGIRALVSYSQNYNYFIAPSGSSDMGNWDSFNKDVRLGVGGQFSIFKTNTLLYPFLDLSYCNVYSSGHSNGGFTGLDNTFTSTTQGLLVHLGLGSKIRIFKSVFLTPEVSYSHFSGMNKETSVSSWDLSTSKFSSVISYGGLTGGLTLGVGF